MSLSLSLALLVTSTYYQFIISLFDMTSLKAGKMLLIFFPLWWQSGYAQITCDQLCIYRILRIKNL